MFGREEETILYMIRVGVRTSEKLPQFVEEIGREFNVSPQTEALGCQRPPVDVLERRARQIRQNCKVEEQ